jgi:hypothetical protein
MKLKKQSEPVYIYILENILWAIKKIRYQKNNERVDKILSTYRNPKF